MFTIETWRVSIADNCTFYLIMCHILVDHWPITDRGLYFRYKLTAEGLIAISTCSRISSKIPSLMLYWEMTKIFNYHKIRYFITSDRRQSRRLWTIDERGSQIDRIYHFSPVRQTNCNPKSLFLTVFDLRSLIASTFSIATYPGCVLIQWIRNQNNLKQELGVIYIFQSCLCWKKSLFPHRIVSNRKHT